MPAARRINKVKALTSALTKARRTKLPRPQNIYKSSAAKGKSTTRCLRLTISCPQVGTLIEPTTSLTFRQYSSACSGPLNRTSSLQKISHGLNQEVSKRAYAASCNAGCPCPFPCGPCGCKGGCGCLPPPCNTPPKCLQYMTGYYYYPYGTWFCGPYHVSGTCSPVGAGCPCPCPVKCCPACVCAPAQNMSTNKNVSDISQFPMEIPCRTPRVPQEARGSMSKIFNFNGPTAGKKDSQQKQKPGVPPILSTLLCLNPYKRPFSLMDKEPRIKSSYPTVDKQRPRFHHTKTNSMPSGTSSKAPIQSKHKNWRYSYYQTRHKAATPIERARIYLKESKNSHRSKLDSVNNSTYNNQKKRDPRPDVDIEIKPYNDSQMN